jgi:serine protease Do
MRSEEGGIAPRGSYPTRRWLRRSKLLLAALVAAGVFGQAGSARAQNFEQLSRDTFSDLAERVSPSVVSVEFVRFRPLSPDAPNGDGIYQSHGGSGVVIRPDGVILTSRHVVAGYTPGRDRLRVETSDGQVFEGDQAQLLAEDDMTDLAILKVSAENLEPLHWGDSRKARPGDWVIVIGNPLDFQFSVSQGIISGINRRVHSEELKIEDLLQTTAVINAGSSGGALVDLDGKLLGVVTAIATTGEAWQGLGFAMPQHIAQPVVESLLESGYVRRGYLGVAMEPARRMGLAASLAGGDIDSGVFLSGVLPGFPADRAGLRPGDRVLAIDGASVESSDDVFRLVGTRAPGDVARLEVAREGQRMSFEVALAERPGESVIRERLRKTVESTAPEASRSPAPPPPPAPPASLIRPPDQIDMIDALGLVVVPRLDGAFGLLTMRVSPGSLAERAGLREGDILLEFEGEILRGVTDFRARLGASRGQGDVLIRAERGSSLFSLRLEIP